MEDVITISRLSDDIRQVFVTAFGENEEMVRLCRDARDPFQHYDKKPVLNMTQDEFVGIFNHNSDHYFLSPVQVLRFGMFCRLPFPNIIGLILKAEWELFLSEMAGYANGSGKNLGTLLYDKYLVELYLPDFKPGIRKIYNMIVNNTGDSGCTITLSQVDFMINDLLDGHKFLSGNDQVSRLYSEKVITEKIMLSNISRQERESYLRLKELWMIKSTALDDMLLMLERKKKLNVSMENKYYRIFGVLEIERVRLTIRHERFRLIISIMHDQPELKVRDLFRLADNRLTEAETERSDIKNKIARSHNSIEHYFPGGSSPAATDEFRNAYMQECRKLLRKIFFLLHPDRLMCHQSLPEEKKTEINELWLELMKSTKDEVYSFSPSMLLYNLPDYAHLDSIYHRACEILGINPDGFEMGNRLEFMIRKGAPIGQIMKFLKSETGQLELHLAQLELVQNEYTNEDQTQVYRDALDDITLHTEKLKSEIAGLKDQIISLKKEISYGLINAGHDKHEQ
ncbi:MAG: J domain-containing protein [Bacteroidales bacterium]|nr:J domain-containing protein [Bacteroidales bacterium]